MEKQDLYDDSGFAFELTPTVPKPQKKTRTVEGKTSVRNRMQDAEQLLSAAQKRELVDFMGRVSDALGMSQVKDARGRVKKADDGFPVYRISKRFGGNYAIGQLKGGDGQPLDADLYRRVRSFILQAVSTQARCVSQFFEARHNEPRCYKALQLLEERIRRIGDQEDPFEILSRFESVFRQMDFTDNARCDFTIRNARKNSASEDRRRAAGIKARNFRNRDLNSEEEEPETPYGYTEQSRPWEASPRKRDDLDDMLDELESQQTLQVRRGNRLDEDFGVDFKTPFDA